MGVMPVNKLLLSMSIPMMISMLVQAMYNIVDSLFVARLGENALAAVSLAFPIQNMMIAIAVGTSVGVNAVLSRSLGEKNRDDVNRAANNGIFLAFLSYFVFLIFGLLGTRAYFAMQTDIEEIIQFGYDYLFLICTVSFGIFGQVIFERLLQSTGRTFYTMITQGVGAVFNIIFDPILIFGFFGFPAMGVRGAALATVIGQIISMGLSIYFNLKHNPDVYISFKKFRPHIVTIRRIFSVGFPSIIMMTIGSVMTYGLNVILLALSSTATAVFGIYFRLQSFIFMPVFGLNNGLVPIIAYNFGARKRERIKKAIIISVAYAVGIMILGTVVFMVFPRQLLSLFNASPSMMAIGVNALRILSTCFPVAGFCIVTGSVLQALFNSRLSMIVSICRQLVVLLPAAWILAHFGGLDLVWWSFPIAEVMSLIMSAVFLRRVYHREIKVLDEKAVYV
ncbi:MATE efflux family protein [Leadbettera azotonutricia ZAS-9]|uniref:Multidrug-efflux transporter n=2 Tax=Leadbettera azotonutricia TaxID=150829 RepID=F5YDI4_LEAAZ|nr:MATE efflux family protein [Leadbettera azotonutricia ZAS-9]